MSEEIETKTIKLGDFTRQEFNYLSELITEKLQEEGINTTSFAFDIEVDYIEEEQADMETPVVAQPRSFLEVLGYHRNPDGTLAGDGPPAQKEENEDEHSKSD
jgi:hypothetical protein